MDGTYSVLFAVSAISVPAEIDVMLEYAEISIEH